MSRVLVVDSDPDTISIVGPVLNAAGHYGRVARTGTDGLSLAKHEPHELILVDLRLPDLSGLEFLADIHAYAPNTAVVIMATRHRPEMTRAAAIQLGAADFIDKPVTHAIVHNVVHKYTAPPDRVPRYDVIKDASTHYAASRWITIVAPLLTVDHDIPTVEHWTRAIGHSQATLKQWCSNAGVRASDSLNFSRALRLVVNCAGHECDWFNALAIVDVRTLHKFLTRAQLDKCSVLPPVEQFLSAQRFVRSEILLGCVRSLLLDADPRRSDTLGVRIEPSLQPHLRPLLRPSMP